jgi:hypothetical protein
MDASEGRCLVCWMCGTQALICLRCDRGQRYCSVFCRVRARSEIARRARAKHRRSEEGRLDHRDAERRRRAKRCTARVADPHSENLHNEANAPSSNTKELCDARVTTEANGRKERQRNSTSFSRTAVVLAPSAQRCASAASSADQVAADLHCLACGCAVRVARFLGRPNRRNRSRSPLRTIRPP